MGTAIGDIYDNGSSTPGSDSKPSQGSTTLPDGDYTATITAAQKKTSKAGNDYLNVTFKVTNGVKTVTVWEILNLWNPNEKAKEIALETLTAITDAGVGEGVQIKDSDELIGMRMGVTVETEENTGYAPKNRIEAYQKQTAAHIKMFEAKRAAEEAAPSPVDDDYMPF